MEIVHDNGAVVNPLVQTGEAHRALELLVEPGQVVELRVLNATRYRKDWPHTASGYFTDANALIGSLEKLHSATGVYITLNPIQPALLARANNRINHEKTLTTTADKNILRRRWLLIDADPDRPSGISSSDAEHQAALTRIQDIRIELTLRGWPNPIEADSGNGGHVIYAIDVPAQDDGLVKRVLEGLALQFDTDTVKIDCSVFNQARISKLYGTRACKGASTTDRPHRMARIIDAPEEFKIVTKEQLDAIEQPGERPPDPATGAHKKSSKQKGKFTIEDFLVKHAIATKGKEPYNGGVQMAPLYIA